jgi:hypothetical protein
MSWHVVFVAFAFVCFVLAAIGVPSGRYNLIAAGLAFLTIALFLPRP